MSAMRAIVVDPQALGRLAIHSVPAPQPLPHEAIVQVYALSVNRGEIRRSQSADAGWRIGWDLAGVIEQAAADGTGFPVGTRVVGFLPEGAWGESIAVPTASLAEIPDGISLVEASTLPVAGLTALFALEKAGSLLAKQVLVLGASGGVGHMACQLARAAGAIVTAQVRRPDQVKFAQASGAQQVLVGEDWDPGSESFDLILDSVGDRSFATALKHLKKDGILVTFGSTAGRESLINVGDFYGKGGLQIYGFILFHEVLKNPVNLGLARLLTCLKQGYLKPHIDRIVPWDQVGQVAQALTDRQFSGKAVLQIRSES